MYSKETWSVRLYFITGKLKQCNFVRIIYSFYRFDANIYMAKS
jgi:hypothetical protein